jgi:hypothetical protein
MAKKLKNKMIKILKFYRTLIRVINECKFFILSNLYFSLALLIKFIKTEFKS